MSSNNLTVVTVFKQNPEWLPEYVYVLDRAIRRNLTVPYRFVCLSDVELAVETVPLLDFHSDCTGHHVPGFWYKPQMFRPELKLTGPCLFFDLDTIIRNNIDHLVEQFRGHKFLMAHDPWKGNVSSSCLMWWDGDYSFIWEKFISRPLTEWNAMYGKQDMTKYGDQGFIADTVEHGIIQQVIANPNEISRIYKKAAGADSRIMFCSGRRKPWNQLSHPDVEKYWI